MTGKQYEYSPDKLISYALEHRYEMIFKYFSRYEKEFSAYAVEATDIWLSSMKIIDNVQTSLEIPFRLKEKTKMYALDGVIVAHTIGMPQIRRFSGLRAYSLSYLASHLFDDFVEDLDKYKNKYDIPLVFSYESLTRSMGLSSPLLTLLAIMQSLSHENNALDYKDQVEILRICMESLTKQINNFLREGTFIDDPETVFRKKNRGVSAEATSLIYDFLQISKFLKTDTSYHFKKALWYLGSLTQFTDDIRDYKTDKESGNPNLLYSIEMNYGKNSVDKLKELYILEDNKMLQELEASKFSVDINLWRSIPWHPFFMKPKTEEQK